MDKKEFRELLDKCLEGAATPEEERRVIEAVRASEEWRGEMLEAAAFEASLRSLGHNPDSFAQRTIEVLGHRDSEETFAKDLRRRLEREGPPRRTRRFPADRPAGWVWAVAATLLVVAGAGLFFAVGRKEPAGIAPEPPGSSQASTPVPSTPRPELPAPPIVPPSPPAAKEKEEAPKKDDVRPVAPAPPLPPPVKPVADPAPTPPQPPEPERPAPRENPPTPVVPPLETRAVAAKVERVDGEAFLVTEKGRTPLQTGHEILPGQGVDAPDSGGLVVLVFPDKTRMQIGRGSEVREISDAQPPRGKRLFVARGTLVADVSRQPQGQPLVIATPHGEATVLGTTLRLVIQPGDKGSTRLEVIEGKVRLTRLADRKLVDVLSGHVAMAAVGVPLVSQPLPPLTQGLVACWSFEEPSGVAAQDESGFEHHGVLVQSPRRVSGKSGQALQFDGARQFIRVPHSAKLNPGTSAWTVAAWVRTTEPTLTQVVFKDDGTLTHYYYLAAGSQAVFEVSPGAGTVVSTARGTRNVADGRWHHLVGVRGADGAVQIYVDGVVEGTTPAQGKPASVQTTSDLTVAFMPFQTSYFRGTVDSVRLYERALSTDEVKVIFGLGR